LAASFSPGHAVGSVRKTCDLTIEIRGRGANGRIGHGKPEAIFARSTATVVEFGWSSDFTVRQHVDAIPDRSQLLLSLQRALLGAVHSQLRQASIEIDPGAQLLRVRFEYDGPPEPAVKESCSGAAVGVIADFPAPWDLDVQHRVAPYPERLLGLKHVAYRRAEQ